jgi:hypothetical protein
MDHLLLFRCNGGITNAPQYYVYMYIIRCNRHFAFETERVDYGILLLILTYKLG